MHYVLQFKNISTFVYPVILLVESHYIWLFIKITNSQIAD